MGRRKKSPLKPPQLATAAAASPDLSTAAATVIAEEEGSESVVSLNSLPADSSKNCDPPTVEKSPCREPRLEAQQSLSPPPKNSLNPETSTELAVNSGSTRLDSTRADSGNSLVDHFPPLPVARSAGVLDKNVQTGSESHSLQAPQSKPPDSAQGKITPATSMSWADRVTTKSRVLRKQGERLHLDSGHAYVKIPNTVIARNKKAWASFVLGQFHGTLPSMGALHAILNGIWSNKTRDISISRAGVQSVLIKIPNPTTRKRVLEQGIWHIEGQTMFVGAWEPGLQAEIPELKEVPVWVDFKDVPPHFFSAEGMEYIAGLVGEPLYLHPRTAAMTNLEVARVFTLVDLRQTLPEAVYVMFESGELHRIEVSCPWLPPQCSHCHQYGHSLRRCPTAPITCTNCKSTTHAVNDCNRSKPKTGASVKRQETKTPTWVPARRASASAPSTLPAESLHVESPINQDASPQVDVTTAVNATSVAVQPQVAIGEQIEVPQQVKAAEPEVVPSQDNNHISETLDKNQSSVRAKKDLLNACHALRIKEPRASDVSTRKSNRVIGKGKSKVLCNVDSANSTSDEDSYVESDVDMHTVLKNLPASIIKRTMRQGKHSKRRDLLENSFY